jgi:hypothetical protein
MLASTEQWDSVTALDHTRFGKYREYFDRMQRTDASTVKLPFDDVFLPGIAELRRVCRGQLITSAPFQEQEPLPKGHLRRFEPADISGLFPNGRLTVLTRPRMPWTIIEERLDGSVALPAERGAPMMFESDTTRYERRIAQLEAEVERLSSRKAIKIANTFGRALRTIDGRVRSLRPGR